MPDDPRGYCGNHQHLLQDGSPLQTTSTHRTDPASTVRLERSIHRIPCPVDPTHWIAADSVDRHILICPKTKQANEQAQKPYYCKECNAGGYGILGKEDFQPLSFPQAQALALAILATHQRVFATPTKTEESINVRLLSMFDIENALDLEDLSVSKQNPKNSEVDGERKRQAQIRFGGEKHTRQQSSLLGHLRCVDDSSESNNTVIIEVGAGRGMMGLVAAAALAAERKRTTSVSSTTQDSSYPGEISNNRAVSSSDMNHASKDTNNISSQKEDSFLVDSSSRRGSRDDKEVTTRLLLIEKTGSRGKADKVFRNPQNSSHTQGNLRLDLVEWQRIACDLKNIQLKSLIGKSVSMQQSSTDSVHVIGKHVCGAGTDLSIRALLPLCGQEEKCPINVKSCILATCCHGVCSWNDYVGRDFLRDALLSTVVSSAAKSSDTTVNVMEQLTQFGRAEFECLRKWCAASVATTKSKTNATNPDDGNDEQSMDAESHKQFAGNNETDVVVAVSTVVESLALSCGINGLGRACQRLLDYGRLMYLRNVLHFERVKLVHYVPSSVTPQNAVLVASNHSSSLARTKPHR